MVVPRRSLDREARPGGDVAALAFVGVAIDDEAKNPNRFLDRPALLAAELRPHRARFDVHVVPCVGVVDRGLHHLLDVIDTEPARYHALLVKWIDPAQLQHAGPIRAVDDLRGVGADDLDELANRRRVDLLARSCDFSAKFEEKAMKILVLLLGRLAPPRGAASHVIDEFVMPCIQAMLFALAEQRDGLPAWFAVDAVKIARAVMLALCRLHAGGIALIVEVSSPRPR